MNFFGNSETTQQLCSVTFGIPSVHFRKHGFELRHFFTVSGIMLMVIAAGLLTNALTALHEATIIANLGHRPWDSDHILPMTSDLGKFLHTLLGYDSAPAMSQIIVYWAYLSVVVVAYLALPRLSSARRSLATLIASLIR